MAKLSKLLSGLSFFYTFKNAKKNKSMKDDTTFDVLQYKNVRSFSKETQNFINLVTIQEDIKPVGSQKFSVARYPGDIDLMEVVEHCCTIDDATRKIAKSIQKIARDIKETTNIYMGDFKTGLDIRYLPLRNAMGEINEYGKIINYDSDKIQNILVRLRKKRLITNHDFSKLTRLIVKKPSAYQWTTLFKLAKKYWVIRWSIDEVIEGKKELGIKLAEKKTMTLEEALRFKTVTKLDLWAPVDGRFTEITNFLSISYMNKNGKVIPVSPGLARYLERMIGDIKHYGDKKLDSYKPMKMAKRMWALAVYIDDKKVLRKLYPLFSSGASMLYQIDAEIEVLIAMLEDESISREIIEDGTYEMIRTQVDQFKMRMSQIYDMVLNDEFLYTIVDDITRTDEREFIIRKLKEFRESVSEDINTYSEEYLEKVGLLDIDYYDHLLKEKELKAQQRRKNKDREVHKEELKQKIKSKTRKILKKSSPKKSSPRKSSPKKTSPKKSSPKKTSPKKSSPKKTSPKKSSPKKTSPKK